MIAAKALLLALNLGTAATPVAEFDIPYFLDNPAVLEETLRRCHQDYRLAQMAECRNAEAAGTRRIGRPLPKDFPSFEPPPPSPPSRPPARQKQAANPTSGNPL